MIFPMAEAMRIGPGASVRLAGAVAQLEEHGAPRGAELDLLEALPGQPQHTRSDDEAAVGGSDHPVPAERVHQPVDRRTREGSRCAELTRAEGPPGASKGVEEHNDTLHGLHGVFAGGSPPVDGMCAWARET